MPVNEKNNYLKKLLNHLEFTEKDSIWVKNYLNGAYLQADFINETLIYPTSQGLKVNGDFTTNFSANENFVVFECVDRLFTKGYKPEHIELEPKWKLGHGASGGRADIFVRDQDNKPLLIIECKTAGKEFDRSWKKTLEDGDQLFSYIEQEKDVKFVCLYSSEFDLKNNELSLYHKVISHKDNLKILEDYSNLSGFSEAKNVKERYRAWKETYNLEYTETGIFEDNVQTYQIGKDKYTLLHDTKSIGSADKKGKYNQFATILRKYNVSRKENAFEVLVNLFLCKIVDETLNPHDLKFYWKGIAYDNYFDFVDRLQELYQKGMEKYLEQEITYVSSDEIDKAFWTYANKKNATRTTIKELFKKLKFFNDNNFGFIGVKNKVGFEKNAKILLEVTQMWQGLQLKTKEQNQFLGDMFEFFLDSGVKQSEGQYFTPVPICKFILNCLPLESMVNTRIEPLKTIDYACGSGHFLTEYCHQIELIAKNNKQNPNDFYQNVYGIEKEDRLAKVSKVSAFMYGFDGINILDGDALSWNPKIKEKNFDILIANPPFAVKEFLTTLSEEDRSRFELTATVSDFNTNDDIQNFFLERAMQLMSPGAVAGIVIPNTILSNTDRISVQTREILLKYFNFISIVELPSLTFGKTGTNTVVIYLERKSKRPEMEQHFKNRVNCWFQNQDIDNPDYMDSHLLEAYCVYCEFRFEEYSTLLAGKPSSELLKREMFVEYRASFDNLTDTKNLIKSRNFTILSTQKQELELNKKFTEYLTKGEKDKLYYFILAHTNPRPVLIVRSPSDTKLAKKFLGYEWSGSKGSEGIRYNGGETVHDINTEMFNPKDREDKSKISYWVRQNFITNQNHIPTNLTQYCQYHPLVNLLDFSRTNFDKSISLSPKKSNPQTDVKSKWEMVKLGEIVNVKGGSGFPEKYQGNKNTDDIPFFKVSDMNTPVNSIRMSLANNYVNRNIINSDLKATIFPKDTIIFPKVGMAIHTNKKRILNAESCVDNNVMALIPSNRIVPYYLYLYFDLAVDLGVLSSGGNPPSINGGSVASFKIPLPPLEIQNQIVEECNIVEKSVENAKTQIERLKSEIEGKVENIVNGGFKMKKLGECCEVLIGGTPSRAVNSYFEGDNLWVSISEMKGQIITVTKEKISDEGVKKSNVKLIPKNTTLVSFKLSIGKTAIAGTDLYTNEAIAGLIPKSGNLTNSFLYNLFTNSNVLAPENVGDKIFGKSLNSEYLKNQVKIPVPPLEIQNQIVAEIEILEAQIAKNKEVIEGSKAEKQEILDKHLK